MGFSATKTILGSTIYGKPHIVSGWWFGCHEFYFPINIGLLIIPIDFHIFQRGSIHTTNGDYLDELQQAHVATRQWMASTGEWFENRGDDLLRMMKYYTRYPDTGTTRRGPIV